MNSETFGFIKTFFQDESLAALKDLTPDERVFIYHMRNAAVAGIPIAVNQYSRNGKHMLKLVHQRISMEEEKSKQEDLNDKLLEQLRSYFVFLVANYGPYFQSEYKNNKYTPERLGFDLITKDELCHLEETNPDAKSIWKGIGRRGSGLDANVHHDMFTQDFRPTATVEGSIEESGVNFHAGGITSEHFKTEVPSEKERNALNVYWDRDADDGNIKKTFWHENMEGVIRDIVSHLNSALGVVRENRRKKRGDQKNSAPDFDAHTERGLEYLILYYATGDEHFFREHSKEWAQMNNRVEYNHGLIECYDDPLQHVGTYQADVTVKSLNMDALLALFPRWEGEFPVHEGHKRKNKDKIPNAAGAHKIFGAGGHGPPLRTIAYCLPNYDDIRSEFGSKQVMYTLPARSDPARFMRIYFDDAFREFNERHSPDLKLYDAIYNLTTTLHETIGHGSGNTIIHGQPERFGKWASGLEEMRAEINAFYCGLTYMDEICATGSLGRWGTEMQPDDLRMLVIRHFLDAGMFRWRSVQDGESEVSGAHCYADTAILYYLVDNCPEGAVQDVRVEEIDHPDDDDGSSSEEGKQGGGGKLEVLRTHFDMSKYEHIYETVKQMMITVQRFACEGPTEEIEAFMQKYAASTRNPRFGSIMKNARDVCGKGVKQHVQIYPIMTAVTDAESGAITDVEFAQPANGTAYEQLANYYQSYADHL